MNTSIVQALKTDMSQLADPEKGFTLIPVSLFIDDKGLAKLEIALARGKKLYDKRKDIKEKDMKRDMDCMKF